MKPGLTGVAGVLVMALVSGCGDSGGGSTDPGTTTAMMTTTDVSPTEGTAATPGTETGETGETGGTTADTDEPTGGTTDPTTGGTSDPEILMLCNQVFADGAKLAEEQCECGVELGEVDDLEMCVAESGTDPKMDACTCEVYSRFPDTKALLECLGPPQSTAAMCAEGVMCTDSPDPLFECLDPYFEALQGCASPSLAVEAALAIECGGIPPFECGSGETIPETWKCDFEVHCMDQTDESACPGTFMCTDGSGWFPEDFKCDGFDDCMDGTDEEGCPTYMCMNGDIILEKLKCNGVPDCADESDEGDAAMCPVFMCMDGGTIPEPFKCDGFPDCMDGSDEVNCPVFMCTDGGTIPPQFECDGEPDCRDGSDELNCP